MEFYPHQLTNAADLVKSVRQCGSAIDASSTGTGKSITALVAASALGKQPFVICPLGVGPGWKDKMEMLREGGSSWKQLDWVNYEKARTPKGMAKLLADLKPERDLIIFDEAHRLGSPKSKQSHMARLLKDKGFDSLCLTATPFDSPMKSRTLLHLTERVAWDSWYGRLPQWGCRRVQHIRGKPWKWNEDPDDILTLKGLLSDSMVATKWGDVEGFPEYVVDCVPVPVTATQRKRVDAIRDGLVPGNAGSTMEIRQELEMIRVSAMVELAKDLMADGNKVVAFFNFRSPLQEFAAAMTGTGPEGTGLAQIHGDVDSLTREINRAAFQKNKRPCALAGIGTAMCEGIDLHDIGNGPVVTLISPPFDAKVLLQEFGRTHRNGGVSKAVHKLIFAAGTMEQTKVMPRVLARRDNIETLTTLELY